MDTKEIEARIEAIREIAWDDEAAHTEEDAFREEFIRYVGTLGIPELSEKADLVLTTNNISFARWHA